MLYRRTLRYEPLEDRRLLAVVTVNTLDDSINLSDGVTSLREAIFATNLVAGPDTIQFAPSLTSSGPAKIRLTLGELRITDSLAIAGPGANLLTIDATASDPTPDQNNGDGSRIAVVDNGSDASLISVSFAGLSLTGGDAAGIGGAILSRENLTLSNCNVTGNSAISDEITLLSSGGGIAHSLGMLLISGSIISHNRADLGGGLHVESGTLVVTGSEFAGNTSVSGSGIYVASGDATVRSSWIHDNSAGAFSLGGGIYNSGNLRVEATTISGNSASFGGGVFSRTDTANGEATRIVNSTISGNTAFDRGGGVRNALGRTIIEHSTITGNQAPPGDGSGVASRGYDTARTEIRHTIIAGNVRSDVDFATGSQNTFQSLGFNLIGNGNALANFQAAGDSTSVFNPMLGPLAGNGGTKLPDGSTIKTHALLPGSPAINAGDLNAKTGIGGVPLYDERGDGFPRIVNGWIDIGAYEFQEPSPLNLVVDTLADESDDNFAVGDLSLREAIELANTTLSADTIRFDSALIAGGPATILLKQGELKITDDITIEGLGDEYLTIDASGNDPTPDIDDGQGSRIFSITDGSAALITAHIKGLTLTGGDSQGAGAIANTENLIIKKSTITGNASSEVGGGISHANGQLVIQDSYISSNRSHRGGGIFQQSGVVTIDNSLVTKNSASLRGGGAFVASGAHTVQNSLIRSNVAAFEGGGLYRAASAAPLTITGSQFSTNSTSSSGSSGGGLFARSGGSIRVINSEIRNNSAKNRGGGVFIESNVLSGQTDVQLVGATISNNRADAHGGGIYIQAQSISILDSIISGNGADGSAGGAYLASGQQLSITGTTFSGNRSNGDGGGAMLVSSQGTVDRSQFISNTASNGGGLWWSVPDPPRRAVAKSAGIVPVDSFPAPDRVITHSTISQNTAKNNGGGLHLVRSVGIRVTSSTISGNTAGKNGGGIARYDSSALGEILAENSTLSGNRAGLGGGGLYIYPASNGIVALVHNTIVSNASTAGFGGGVFYVRGTLVLDHNIIATNTDGSGVGPDLSGNLGIVLAPKYNLIGTNVGTGLIAAPLGSPDSNGNLIGGATAGARINPNLASLNANGGPTMTHALLPSSPAINAGDPLTVAGLNGAPLYDQRGSPFTRVFAGRIDMGAFETRFESLAGDYNQSGLVDTADYVLWRNTVGSTDLRADGNGDGIVNNADLQIWRANFGRTAAGLGQGAGSLESDAIVAVGQPSTLPGGSAAETESVAPRRANPVMETSRNGIATLGPRAVGSRPWRREVAQFNERDDNALLNAVAFTRDVEHDREAPTHRTRSAIQPAVDGEPALLAAAIDSVFHALGSFKPEV